MSVVAEETQVVDVREQPAEEGYLRSASETAERERTRLAAAAGRPAVLAALSRVGLRLRHAGSEEAARNGLRYQPVAWTAIALVAVSFFWPGRPDAAAPPSAPIATATVTPTTTVPPAPTPTPTTLPPVSLPATGPAAPPPAVATTPTTTTTTTTTPPAPAAEEPLTVRGFGWASVLAGTGVAAAEVPEGTMPISARLGQTDKVTFIRLSGTVSTLILEEDTGGAREAMGAGTVLACAVIDEGWSEAPDQSFDDAPAWDPDRCVASTEADDVWTFDLSGFDDRTGDRGFALVPGSDAPPDFQITLRPA